MSRSLAPLILTLCLGAPGMTATVFPVETFEPLHNPGMGWAIVEYTHDPDLGKSWPADEGPIPYPWYDGVQVLFTWAGIEKQPGQFDWSAVDRVVDYWSSVGKTVHIIASTQWYFNHDDFIGCPEWIYAMGVPKSGSREGDGLFPDENHPVYRERLRPFMEEFARHFCEDPRIGQIAIRAHGIWGEWHTGYAYRTATERVSAANSSFDIWREAIAGRKLGSVSVSYEWRFPDFAGYPGILPTGTSVFDEYRPTYRDFLERSGFARALSFPAICARRDGVAGAVFMEWDGRLLADQFAHYRRPIWCEPFGGYEAFTGPSPVGFPGTREGDNFLGNAIDEALSHHANNMTMHWGTDFHRKQPDLVAKAQRMLGYRLALVRASFPDTLRPGGDWVLQHTWENRGVGRCLDQYPLALYLLQGEAVAWSGVDNDFDPRYFTAGETYDLASHFTLPQGLPPGTYDLRIALIGPDGDPALNLPLAGADAHRRTLLGQVTVAAEPAATETLPPSVASLEPNHTYLVSFRYQITRDPERDLHTDDPGYFRCYMVGGDGVHVGECRWFDKAGQPPARKTLLFALRDRDDYQLVFEPVGGGDMTVDGTRIEALPTDSVRRVAMDADLPTAVARDLVLRGGATAFDRRGPPCPHAIIVAERERSQVKLPDDNYDFLETNPASVRLEPNTTYTVWFTVAVRPQIWQGDYAYFAVRSAKLGQAADIGPHMLVQRHTSNPVRRAYTFRSGDTDDTRLVWGLHNGGRAEVSQIVIVRR